MMCTLYGCFPVRSNASTLYSVKFPGVTLDVAYDWAETKRQPRALAVASSGYERCSLAPRVRWMS